MTESNITIHYASRSQMDNTTFGYIMCGFRIPSYHDFTRYIIVDNFKQYVNVKDEDDVDDFLNGMFKKYNNSETNPLCTNDKQQFIKDNQTYTSMSVGSIIQIDDAKWVCRGLGWRKLDY